MPGEGDVWSAHLQPSIPADNCSMLFHDVSLGHIHIPSFYSFHSFTQTTDSYFSSCVVVAISISICEWRILYPVTNKYKTDSMKYQYGTVRILCPGLGCLE